MATLDLDVVTPMTDENLRRIHSAMQGINARFRMHPDKPRLWDDPNRLRGFQNIYLTTDLGVIDLLGELPNVCRYDDLVPRAVKMHLGTGLVCRVIDLETLITAKRAAGRDKDIIGVKHLEAIKRYQQQNPGLFDQDK